MSYRYPDHVERLLATAKIPSEYDFEQLVSEAVVRIGKPLVETYLMAAARDFGWPIPPAQRLKAACELGMLVELYSLPRA